MGFEDRAYNQDGSGSSMRFGFLPPPPMAMAVMAACILVFILQAIAGPFIGEYFPLTFTHGEGLYEPWRFITYQYVHGDTSHIFWNILGIYFFLPQLERLWGPLKAFVFYTMGGVVGGITYGLLHLCFPSLSSSLIGASGSILAALGACAYLFPEQTILLFFVFAVPIRALAAVLALFYALSVIGGHNGADACHFAGLAFGVAAPYYSRRFLGTGFWGRFNQKIQAKRIERDRSRNEAEEASIDRILQKVSDHGMHSLTNSEKRTLQRATKRQRSTEGKFAQGKW